MQVRKPTFDFSGVKRYYFAENAWATHTMNALHVIVPIGELFFVRAVRVTMETTAEGGTFEVEIDFCNRIQIDGSTSPAAG